MTTTTSIKIFAVTLTLAGALNLGGCATNPNEIAPSYVSPIQYDGYSCSQLGQEAARLSGRAAEVAVVQKNKATGDAVAMGVGLVLFWPSIFFIKGDGTTASEIAQLKGQMNAVEQASIAKKCNIEFVKPTGKK